MLRRSRWTLLAVVPTVMALGRPARAEPSADPGTVRLPVPKAQRPLTLPRLVLGPELGFAVDRQANAGVYGDLDVSARLGITDDLSVHALVAPLQLWAPGGGGFYYGETTRNRGPGVGATYRFVRGNTEIAVSLTGEVFTVQGLSGGSVTPSVPIRIHATDELRLDVTPTVSFWIATETITVSQTIFGPVPLATPQTSSANAVRVQIPMSALYNLTEAFDVGLTTGLTIYDVSHANDTTGIPLGAFLGYVVAGAHGPIVDIDPYFTFPYLVLPGRRSVTNTGQYVVGLNVTGYLYL